MVSLNPIREQPHAAIRNPKQRKVSFLWWAVRRSQSLQKPEHQHLTTTGVFYFFPTKPFFLSLLFSLHFTLSLTFTSLHNHLQSLNDLVSKPRVRLFSLHHLQHCGPRRVWEVLSVSLSLGFTTTNLRHSSLFANFSGLTLFAFLYEHNGFLRRRHAPLGIKKARPHQWWYVSFLCYPYHFVTPLKRSSLHK